MSNMREVDDGMITGIVLGKKLECSNCGNKTMCIHITKITLPPGIEPFPRLIFYERNPYIVNDVLPIEQIGIGCGCYGRANRQIAYLYKSAN